MRNNYKKNSVIELSMGKIIDSEQQLAMRFQGLHWRNGMEKQAVATESSKSCNRTLGLVGSISHIL